MTPAHERKAAERQRRKDAGLVRIEAWVPQDQAEAIKKIIADAVKKDVARRQKIA